MLHHYFQASHPEKCLTNFITEAGVYSHRPRHVRVQPREEVFRIPKEDSSAGYPHLLQFGSRAVNEVWPLVHTQVPRASGEGWVLG